MPGTTIRGDFGTLEAETEMIDVTSGLPYPNERWTYTDRQGHEHRYSRRAAGDYYPTLVWVVDETYWCEDCRDEHTDGHYECAICGEHITPRLRGPDLSRKYIPGLTSYYLNGEPITKERADELMAGS
jgi:hypothetical protein